MFRLYLEIKILNVGLSVFAVLAMATVSGQVPGHRRTLSFPLLSSSC